MSKAFASKAAGPNDDCCTRVSPGLPASGWRCSDADSVIRYATTACTDVGLVREINEDRLLDAGDYGVWAVADGMGGHSHGARAAQTVVDALAGTAMSETPNALVAAVQHANAKLFADTPPGQVVGATVAVLQIAGEAYRCFWAGDCRIFRLRAGTLRQLTVDHTEVQEMIAAGIIAPEVAECHPRRHVVTRAVGVRPTVELDCAVGSASAGDVFVLCSDGLTLAPAELVLELQSAGSSSGADRLVRRALANGSRDNVTALVVTLVH